VLLCLSTSLWGQNPQVLSPLPVSQRTGTSTPATALYQQLGNLGLDPKRVYSIRDASLDHGDLHISLDDGTLAFTQDVLGKITGAFFEGEGEVLLTPPNQGERISLSLFTGAAILEEKFTSAYLRFNDDLAAELAPTLRLVPDNQAFATHNDSTARVLAQADALRLLISFSRLLPASGDQVPVPFRGNDHFLHARVVGTKLGIFDLFYDTTVNEQVSVGQMSDQEGVDFYDSWASFSLQKAAAKRSDQGHVSSSENEDDVRVSSYRIRATISPPQDLSAEASVDVQVGQGGSRTLLFELSRFLEVQRVEANGSPVEFIHNPSLEGTERARRGNDLLLVIFPSALQEKQHLKLRFVYSGAVLSQAGTGLLYVGARGTWYPNRGIAMADFDLQFRYPQEWTLVATGKHVAIEAGNDKSAPGAGESTSHWVSERPIPVAGFNLGRYTKATARAGNIEVASYATIGVENRFPQTNSVIAGITRNDSTPLPTVEATPTIVAPPPPSPARHVQAVADRSADAVNFFSEMLGPYPYSKLALTQLPGSLSQGFPGLIFLSSYVFLNRDDRAALHLTRAGEILYGETMTAHETAHQWWGDLVAWHSYRDQWIEEALANYCAFMMLQKERPADFQAIMDQYRRDLLSKNKDDQALKDAGPVSLGARLSSSRFPNGYNAIAYGRGTWLLHMLRTMLNDSEAEQNRESRHTSAQPEPFVRALRRLQERLAGKELTVEDLQAAFEEELPRPLWYEHRKSLDWFFHGWVNGTAVPEFELRNIRISKGAKPMVSGTVLQKHAPSDLVTSVPIYGVSGRGNNVLLGRIFVEGENSEFRVSAPSGISKVVLDPYQTVLTAPK